MASILSPLPQVSKTSLDIICFSILIGVGSPSAVSSHCKAPEECPEKARLPPLADLIDVADAFLSKPACHVLNQSQQVPSCGEVSSVNRTPIALAWGPYVLAAYHNLHLLVNLSPTLTIMAGIYSPLQDRPIKETICLFDVDGTLSPARQAASMEMLQTLSALRHKCAIGFVRVLIPPTDCYAPLTPA